MPNSSKTAVPASAAPVATTPAKKSYHAPQLSIYGEVREITKSIVGGTGMNDSVHGNDKTAP
jgi:hypothetical protein